MLSIVQRGGATREKPPEVVRGRSSRLPWVWDGLCFAVPFNDATQDAARDVVANARPSVVTGLAWTKDNRGNTAALLADNTYVSYPDNPAHNAPTTIITVYVRLRRRGTIIDPTGGLLSKHYAATDPWMSWGILCDDLDATALGAHLTVGGTWHYWRTTYSLPTTTWVSAVMRWRSGSAPRIDILGERGESLATQTHNQTPTGSISYVTGEPITFNSGIDNTWNFNADYSQGMVWSRYLTDQEIQALVADPYGWYSPRRETVGVSSPYPLVFGGGEMKHGTGSGGLR